MANELVELAEASVERFGARELFGERRDDRWEWITYAAWWREVAATRARLARLGIQRGDRIAIISRNSTAWATAAYATYGLGATFVPMYEAQRPEDWEYILRDSGAAIALCRTPAIADAVDAMRDRLPALHHVLVLDAPAGDPRALSALEAAPEVLPVHPAPDEIAGLIYTSGTTGVPKGVMLAHANLVSNIEGTLSAFPLTADDRTVSFLPWAHVYGQVCELHILIAAGASTAFNTSTDQLLDDLRDVRPTILIAVPRIFNRLHASVTAQLETKPRVIRAIFRRGLAITAKRRNGERIGIGERIIHAIAGLLFAKIRKKLGGRLRYAISGSATLSREVAAFVDGIGIEVYEGYGLTETSPIVSFNRPGRRKLGSVGLPIEGVRIEIDRSVGDLPGEGEIVIHGPNVMKGYHGLPDETARALTADGGLRTGDLGHLDEDGFLYITGRVKEQYKLENGKYVMPAPLEEQLALSPYVTSVMLHGSDHPYNVALVAIDTPRVRAWATEHAVETGPDPTADQRVRAAIEDDLERRSALFRSYERPRAYLFTDATFSVENGLLTPTLKLKRREILARYGRALEALYA